MSAAWRVTPKQFFQTGASRLLIPVSSILTGPLIARALGPSDRGAMAALVVPISLVNLLFTAGLPESLTYFTTRKEITRYRAMQLALGVGGAIGLGAAIAVVLASPLILVHYPDLKLPFGILAASLPFSIALAGVRGVAAGLRRFDLVLGEQLVGTALRTLLILGLVFAGALTATGAAAVTIWTAVCGSLALMLILTRPPYRHMGATSSRAVLVFSGVTGLGTLGNILILRLDQTLMAPLASPKDLGVYAVAVSLAELPLALSTAIKDVVFVASVDSRDARYTSMACRRTVVFMVLICGAGILAAPLIMPLLFGSAFRQSVSVTQVLLIGSVFSAITTVVGTGLISLRRPVARTVVMLSGATLTVPLLIFLVPRYGAMGAAWATLLTYICTGVFSTLLFARLSGEGVATVLLPRWDDAVAVVTPWRLLRSSRMGSASETPEG